MFFSGLHHLTELLFPDAGNLQELIRIRIQDVNGLFPKFFIDPVCQSLSNSLDGSAGQVLYNGFPAFFLVIPHLKKIALLSIFWMFHAFHHHVIEDGRTGGHLIPLQGDIPGSIHIFFRAVSLPENLKRSDAFSLKSFRSFVRPDHMVQPCHNHKGVCHATPSFPDASSAFILFEFYRPRRRGIGARDRVFAKIRKVFGLGCIQFFHHLHRLLIHLRVILF